MPVLTTVTEVDTACGCKKLNDGILQAAEVHFAPGRQTVVSGARVVNGARIVNGAEKKII